MAEAKTIKKITPTQRRIIIGAVCMLCILAGLLLGPTIIVRTYHAYSYDNPSRAAENLTLEPRIALVLGGGINNDGTPRPVLRERLDAAVRLYQNNMVDGLLVSGDNRMATYNEPQAMKQYLEKQKIPTDDITEDFAGRSTYESCNRAHAIFELKQVLIVTQTGHLDRALFLCRSFGIEAFGYAAQYPRGRVPFGQLWREVLSNLKAVINVYVIGERTVLGYKIPLQ
jgi:vancomycin permeability regulator SanA